MNKPSTAPYTSIKYLLTGLFMLLACATNAQWAYFSSPWATTAAYSGSKLSVAVSRDGQPYIFYCGNGAGDEAMVVSAPADQLLNWNSVGPTTFSPGTVAYCNIAVDTFGTPYVAYQDGANGYKATVMKFDGTNWVNVGIPGFSAGVAEYISMALDRSGKPYVVYRDQGHGNKATVMKFNGTSWVNVGSAGFSTTSAHWTSLALDTAGTPYVVFCDTSTIGGYVTVMKYNGTTWVTVGNLTTLGKNIENTVIGIDTAAAPYIAFTAKNYGDYVMVMKYDATAGFWDYLNPEPIGGPANYVSMAMNKHGIPYVIFDDGSTGGASTVMTYNGTGWASAGAIGFSGPGYNVNSVGIAIDDTGNLYALWKWATISTTASVQKLTAGSATISGHFAVCAGDTISLTESLTGGTWSDAGFCSCVTTYGPGKIATHSPGGVERIQYHDGSGDQIAYVSVLPKATPITGPTVLCDGATVSLTDGVGGGTWTSVSTAIASVSSGGSVHGSSAGTDTIFYALKYPYGCGSSFVVVTVNPQPSAITGTSDICLGGNSLFTNALPGGTWSSTPSSVATIDPTGLLTSVSTGIAHITYTAAGGCDANTVVAIDPVPSITSGSTTLCAGDLLTLFSSLPGGTWTSSDVAVATTDATSGLVSGIATGTVTITYTMSTSCFTTIAIAVNCIAGVQEVSRGSDITIAPNPVQNELTIASSSELINDITITNLVGQVVYAHKYNTAKVQMNITDMSKGVYFIKVNNREARKLVKE